MSTFIYTLLLVAVCYSGVKSDARCFLQKLTGCAQKLGTKASLQMPDFLLCKYRQQMFACIRDSAKECSVDKRYDFTPTEDMYNNVCTDGTPMNLKFNKYKDCIFTTISKSTSCVRDIIDFVAHHTKITPEVMFEIEQLTCKERTTIVNCYLDFIEKDCGKDARDFYETLSEASDKVNDQICQDILNE